jgi:hypothetical protein
MKDKIEIYEKWDDHLCWCPSQCYLKLQYLGINYQIYLRWRWTDPWSAELQSDSTSIKLNIPFYKDSELDLVKDSALRESKRILYSKEHLLNKYTKSDFKKPIINYQARLREKKINKILEK